MGWLVKWFCSRRSVFALLGYAGHCFAEERVSTWLRHA
jgi:hypothetical protein